MPFVFVRKDYSSLVVFIIASLPLCVCVCVSSASNIFILFLFFIESQKELRHYYMSY